MFYKKIVIVTPEIKSGPPDIIDAGKLCCLMLACRKKGFLGLSLEKLQCSPEFWIDSNDSKAKRIPHEKRNVSFWINAKNIHCLERNVLWKWVFSPVNKEGKFARSCDAFFDVTTLHPKWLWNFLRQRMEETHAVHGYRRLTLTLSRSTKPAVTDTQSARPDGGRESKMTVKTL